MLTDTRFILEFGECNGLMHLELHDRYGLLQSINEISTQEVDLAFKIKLPNTLKFILSNKNYSTDTKLNHHGSIIKNKYIKLKKFWLGGIAWSAELLPNICQFKTDDNELRYNPFWDKNGEVIIEIFDKNFIEFHLHYNNIINL